MLDVPSNSTPPIVLDVFNFVVVAELNGTENDGSISPNASFKTGIPPLESLNHLGNHSLST